MALVSTLFCIALVTAQSPSPGMYLRAGDKAMESQKWDVAVSMYEKGLKTNMLNDAGRAMAYWNLSVAYKELSKIDNEAISLLGFIVYALNVKHYVNSLPLHKQAVDSSAGWLRYFRAERRLALAAERLQILWETRKNEKRVVHQRGNGPSP